MPDHSHCVVVGAGVIGIACGIALRRRGLAVTLVDPEPPGSMTSSGNAGGFGVTEVMPVAAPGVIWKTPGWLLDPCGPLSIHWRHLPALLPWLWRFHRASNRASMERISLALAALLQRCSDDTHTLAREAGLSPLLTANGALTVYRNQAAFEGDRLEWDLKRARGVAMEEVDADAIRQMEPELHNARFGWYTPQWFNTVDPFRFALGLADHFRALGGAIVRDRVTGFETGADGIAAVHTEGGTRIDSQQIVIAAGVWSAELCRRLGENVVMAAERGYNTTLPNPGVHLNRQVIFGEEKFVVTRIGEGLRIGGAAEFASLNTRANYARSRRLVEVARRYLPDLDTSGGSEWMGQRPSTPDSLPVISPSGRYANLHHAFGHGHLGLTMAATTAKLVAQLVMNEIPPYDAAPYHIDRFN